MKLTVNTRLDFTVIDLDEGWRCVVVDDFLANPEELVALGASRGGEFLYPERAYPGGVLPLDDQLLEPVNRFLRREMSPLRDCESWNRSSKSFASHPVT